jgi:uncharacterized protein YecE (DUF72 family)
MPLLIGCSGWSYEDWVGPFYPVDMDKREWLDYYSRYFPTVEINSTFYRFPNVHVVKAWVEKGCRARDKRRDRWGSGKTGAPEQDGFRFSLKLPQDVTHKKLVKQDVKGSLAIARDFEKKVMAPLADEELDGSTLLQLSPYFKHDRNGKGLTSLRKFLNGLDTSTYQYTLELRHSTWIEKKERTVIREASDLLADMNVALCVIDGPGFPDIDIDTAGHVYVRFHGRNRDLWFKKKNGKDEADPSGRGRMNRYDYLYSRRELEPWAGKLGDFRDTGARAYVYFNNHPMGKGPKNAMQVMDLVKIKHEKKDIKITSQQTLI